MANYIAVALFAFISVAIALPTFEQNFIRVRRVADADPRRHHGHNDGHFGGFHGEYATGYNDYGNYPHHGYGGNFYPHGGHGGNFYPNGNLGGNQGFGQSSANAQASAGNLNGQNGYGGYGGLGGFGGPGDFNNGGSYAQANAQASSG